VSVSGVQEGGFRCCPSRWITDVALEEGDFIKLFLRCGQSEGGERNRKETSFKEKEGPYPRGGEAHEQGEVDMVR